jgi:hypothetical protein
MMALTNHSKQWVALVRGFEVSKAPAPVCVEMSPFWKERFWSCMVSNTFRRNHSSVEGTESVKPTLNEAVSPSADRKGRLSTCSVKVQPLWIAQMKINNFWSCWADARAPKIESKADEKQVNALVSCGPSTGQLSFKPRDTIHQEVKEGKGNKKELKETVC